MNKRGSIKKDLIIFFCIIVIAIIVLTIKVMNDAYVRYDIGDYGVSIRVPRNFSIDKDDEDNLLALHTDYDEIVIKAKDLRGDFWSSDEMDVIIDEYIRVISAVDMDRNIYDVEFEKRKIDFKETGVVKLTSSDRNYASREVAILTHKANGYLVIEIYGNVNIIDENEKMIESIVNSIKYGKNNHDYSQDDSKGVLDVYRDIFGNEISIESGDTTQDKINKVFGIDKLDNTTINSGE